MAEPAWKIEIRTRADGSFFLSHTILSEDGVRYSKAIDHATKQTLAQEIKDTQEAHAKLQRQHYELAKARTGEPPES